MLVRSQNTKKNKIWTSLINQQKYAHDKKEFNLKLKGIQMPYISWKGNHYVCLDLKYRHLNFVVSNDGWFKQSFKQTKKSDIRKENPGKDTA